MMHQIDAMNKTLDQLAIYTAQRRLLFPIDAKSLISDEFRIDCLMTAARCLSELLSDSFVTVVENIRENMINYKGQ